MKGSWTNTPQYKPQTADESQGREFIRFNTGNATLASGLHVPNIQGSTHTTVSNLIKYRGQNKTLHSGFIINDYF